MTKSFRIKTNASNLIIRAFLNQKNDNDKWHSMTYYLKKLSSTKQNYDVVNKKLLTIVIALNYWKTYVERTIQLDIYTNHKNLMNFIIIKTLQRRQIRWWKKLTFYKFKIHYVNEKENEFANNLSRRCDYMKNKKVFNHNILKINENETLFANHWEITTTMRILRDEQNNFQQFMRNCKYRKNMSTNILKSITMIHYKDIREWQKHYNFYDNIVNSHKWGKRSRHTSKNVIIAKRISTRRMHNMRKYNIKNH